MELMDNNSNIVNVTPKLLEFPEHFIMNTQLYEKQTLKPVPMKFYVSEALNPFMLLQTSIDKSSSFYGHDADATCYWLQDNVEHNNQNIIQDRNDSAIFYIIQRIYANSEGYDRHWMRKVQYNKTTKQYNILKSFVISSSGNAENHKGTLKILHETDEYFVLSVLTQHGYSKEPYGYGCISLLNKKTFEYTRLIGTGFANFVLKVENDTLYVLSTNADFYTRQIIKINTSSKVCTAIWTETTIANKGISCNPIQIGDYYYVLTPHLQGSLYSYKIMKISLDTINDTVNTELININLNGFMLDNSSSKNMAYTYYIKYTLRLIQTKTNTFISLLMHTTANVVGNYNHQCKHVLLRMSDTSFDVVDLVQLRDGCYGSLENNDSKHQVWYTPNCVLFYVFDEAKEKMICTYKKPGVFMQIGFDSLNRFITQTTTKTIEILTDTNACILQADFEEQLYDKDNNSLINTMVNFYAKNFLDEFLKVNVKLTLIGPVVFTENNSKELIVSTLKTGIKTVPVTITGCGNIQVVITQDT